MYIKVHRIIYSLTVQWGKFDSRKLEPGNYWNWDSSLIFLTTLHDICKPPLPPLCIHSVKLLRQCSLTTDIKYVFDNLTREVLLLLSELSNFGNGDWPLQYQGESSVGNGLGGAPFKILNLNYSSELLFLWSLQCRVCIQSKTIRCIIWNNLVFPNYVCFFLR